MISAFVVKVLGTVDSAIFVSRCRRKEEPIFKSVPDYEEPSVGHAGMPTFRKASF